MFEVVVNAMRITVNIINSTIYKNYLMGSEKYIIAIICEPLSTRTRRIRLETKLNYEQ